MNTDCTKIMIKTGFLIADRSFKKIRMITYITLLWKKRKGNNDYLVSRDNVSQQELKDDATSRLTQELAAKELKLMVAILLLQH